MLASGGVLATADNTTISGTGVLESELTGGTQFAPTAFARELIFHVVADPGTLLPDTLTVSPTIFGTGGLTKAEGGTLALTSQETYIGQTTINGGSIKLAGLKNTLFTPWTPAPLNTHDGDRPERAGHQDQRRRQSRPERRATRRSRSSTQDGSYLPFTGGSGHQLLRRPPLPPWPSRTTPTSLGRAISPAAGSTCCAWAASPAPFNSPNDLTGTVTLAGGRTDLVDLGTSPRSPASSSAAACSSSTTPARSSCRMALRPPCRAA